MKRIILIFIVIMVFLICGCENKFELEQSREPDSGDSYIQFYVDPKTKVEYVLYYQGYGGGICPRYNADGNLYIQGGEAND